MLKIIHPFNSFIDFTFFARIRPTSVERWNHEEPNREMHKWLAIFDIAVKLLLLVVFATSQMFALERQRATGNECGSVMPQTYSPYYHQEFPNLYIIATFI